MARAALGPGPVRRTLTVVAVLVVLGLVVAAALAATAALRPRARRP